MLPPSLSIDDLKRQARNVRRALDSTGRDISHSQALEIIAKQYGYYDWNTLHAALGNKAPTPLHLGQHVSGDYLGQRFSGEIIALRDMGGGQNYRVTLRFDEPVDVITFESWSSFRRQVNATVDRHGRTVEKTSNGLPHMQIELN